MVMQTNRQAKQREMNAPLEQLRARLRMLQSGAVEAEADARAQLRKAEARLASVQRCARAQS
jgi:hypothetical protein